MNIINYFHNSNKIKHYNPNMTIIVIIIIATFIIRMNGDTFCFKKEKKKLFFTI